MEGMDPTYYDVLKDRDTSLIKYVKRDIEALEEDGLDQPVRSPDEIDKMTGNHNQYVEENLKGIAESVRKMAIKSGMNDTMADLAKQQFLRSPEAERAAESCTLEYLSVLNFEMYNKKTFYISNSLVDHLMQTKLDAPSKYVRLPFQSCLFFYTEHEVIKAYSRVVNRKPDLNVPISVFASSVPAEEGDKKIIFSCWQADYDKNLAATKRELLIRKDWSIGRMLKTDWHDIYDMTEGEDDSGFYENSSLDFFRVLLNTILYLSSNDPDIVEKLSRKKDIADEIERKSSKSKLRKLKSRARSLSELDYKLVGKKTDRIKVKKPNRGSSGSGNRKNKRAKRILVRGHWRNQPYGEGMEKRKLIWIEPYYRGPDMAEVVNKPYDVE